MKYFLLAVLALGSGGQEISDYGPMDSKAECISHRETMMDSINKEGIPSRAKSMTISCIGEEERNRLRNKYESQRESKREGSSHEN
jgi:hypothetical protein